MKNSELSDDSKYLIAAAIAIPFIVACSAFGAWLFMLLWNFVVPSVFGGSVLNFWQAWGLTTLLWFIGNLFKGSSSSKG